MGDDILARLKRHRSRYATPESGWSRSRRWLWSLLGLWAIYVGVLSEHSLWRLWRVRQQAARTAGTARETQAEADRIDRQIHEPAQRRDLSERVLREEHGLARKGEEIYRLEGESPDSLPR